MAGDVNIPLVLAAISLATLTVDFAWYELGRRTLYRWSSDPDACRRRAETVFSRHGARSMLIAKFFPGLTTLLPPLAGVFAVTRLQFALYDLAGVLLWAGAWLAVGYVYSDGIVLITARLSGLGHMLGAVVVILFLGYALFKY